MLEPQTQAPSTCSHKVTDRREIKSDFFKRQFLAEADVCRSCGQSSWTPETQKRFAAWINALKQERRDLFQLQFYIPEAAWVGLNETLRDIPGVTPSDLIRVLVTVYLSAHIRYPEFKELLGRLASRQEYHKYSLGPRRKTSVQFRPMAMLDIQSWAEVLKLRPYKIVEDAIFNLLALRNETDARLREFWDKNLLPHIEIILRAV